MLKHMTLFTCLATISTIQAKEIVVSAYANSGQISLIQDDLTFLKNLKFDPANSQYLAKAMQLKKNETLYDWLNQRVNYILEEDYFTRKSIFNFSPITVEKKNIIYPNFDIFPDNIADLFENQPSSMNNATIVMSNIGTSLYLHGKVKNELLSIRFHENKNRVFKKKLIINSPRIGIIQIGSGLFRADVRPNPLFASAPSNRFHRLATLLHEARHSDGNGKSLGFLHIKCPEGHNYAGANACDNSTNGPYVIGAQATVDAIKWCGNNCSPTEITMLRAMALDSFSRVITPENQNSTNAVWDASPEFLK